MAQNSFTENSNCFFLNYVTKNNCSVKSEAIIIFLTPTNGQNHRFNLNVRHLRAVQGEVRDHERGNSSSQDHCPHLIHKRYKNIQATISQVHQSYFFELTQIKIER